MSQMFYIALTLLSALTHSWAQSSPAPSQPPQTNNLNQFSIVGNSLVSAQQAFVGTSDKVYIVDKTENNPVAINGHPAWASEYSLSTNKARAMDAVTNSFCAGGSVLGNGTWMNVGGNQAVTYGGVATGDNGGPPFDDPDGGQSIRLLDPNDDMNAAWILTTPMTTARWYPTLETLEDGSMIIIGGCTFGGYVNDPTQTNPTYEFFPSRGGPIESPLLDRTLPTNLYPLTWLLPSGNLLMQSNRDTIVLDYKNNKETPMDNIPDAVRTYPASAGTAMLPLTPANNWTATIMFCGGTDLQNDQWNTNWNIAAYPASQSCVKITPDVSTSYVHDDNLPGGRSMGNMVLLPDDRIFVTNGAAMGTAGYGNLSWAIGESFADSPDLQPIIYNPNAPQGSRWSSNGLSPSTIPRMYHSVATLLPDGSIFVSGSNPNYDVNTKGVKYPTEYRVEIFYPSYFNERRPEPQGLLQQLSYGGPPFNVSLSKDDLFGSMNNIQNATVVVMRTGFSTHTMNMGMRSLHLDMSYTGNADGSGVLHVSQMPPNPAVFAPGPAFIFVVVNGVPSIGSPVMVGSGRIENQTTLAVSPLPSSSTPSPSSQGQSGGNQSKKNASTCNVVGYARLSLVACFTLFLWTF